METWNPFVHLAFEFFFQAPYIFSLPKQSSKNSRNLSYFPDFGENGPSSWNVTFFFKTHSRILILKSRDSRVGDNLLYFRIILEAYSWTEKQCASDTFSNERHFWKLKIIHEQGVVARVFVSYTSKDHRRPVFDTRIDMTRPPWLFVINRFRAETVLCCYIIPSTRSQLRLCFFPFVAFGSTSEIRRCIGNRAQNRSNLGSVLVWGLYTTPLAVLPPRPPFAKCPIFITIPRYWTHSGDRVWKLPFGDRGRCRKRVSVP